MQSLNHESVRVLMLDKNHCLTREQELFRGTAGNTAASSSEILQPVILHRAAGFVLVHNHPSGDPTPSTSDSSLTKRIHEACKLLELHFLDHIIIGHPAPTRVRPYFSFRESGMIH
jgi:DNA repair protein RadC